MTMEKSGLKGLNDVSRNICKGLTLSSLNLLSSSSNIPAANCCCNSRLVVDKDDWEGVIK